MTESDKEEHKPTELEWRLIRYCIHECVTDAMAQLGDQAKELSFCHEIDVDV